METKSSLFHAIVIVGASLTAASCTSGHKAADAASPMDATAPVDAAAPVDATAPMEGGTDGGLDAGRDARPADAIVIIL